MLKLVFKNRELQDIKLDKPRLTLGRDPSNDCVLNDEGVSGFHAEIQQENELFYVVDLGSSNGTFVNGSKVNGKQLLKAWDRLVLDKLEIEVVDPDVRKPTLVRPAIQVDDLPSKDNNATTVRPALSDWALKAVNGPLKGKVFPVNGKLLVGREAPADILIAKNEISRKHAVLELRDNKLYVKDLGSANGTRINDSKINEAVLNVGDVVYFDEVGFTVSGPEVQNKTAVRPAVQNKTAVRPAVTKTQVSHAIQPSLKVVSGNMAGRQFDLNKNNMTIGREESCEIFLDDPTVSGRHAVITVIDNDYSIRNLSQTNSLLINGNQVPHASLKHGDQIQLGKVTLQFEEPGKSAPAKTQVMSSINASNSSTHTMQQPALLSRLPTWLYGVISFLVVAIVFAGVLFYKNGSEKIQAKLQGGRVWQQQLASGRTGPTTPALADINGDGYLDVVLADAEGFILALDGVEGKKIFETEVRGKVLAAPEVGDITGDGVDDIIIASSAGVITAINGKGQVIWRSQENLGLGLVLNKPVLMKLNDDDVPDVIVPSNNKGLVALDGSRGWEIWNTEEMTRGKVMTAPLLADVNHDGVMEFISLSEQGQLMAMSVQRGKIWQLWEARLPEVLYASPMYLQLEGHGLIVSATNKGLIAVNADNGRMAWQKPLNKSFFASPVATDGNGDGSPDVVAISTNGDIYVLDGITGDEIWSAALGTNIKASPAVFDVNYDGLGDLVILTERGEIMIMDMARGRPLLSTSPATGSFIASPVMGDLTNDGMLEIVAASKEGTILAFGINRAIDKGQAYWPVFLGNNSHNGGK